MRRGALLNAISDIVPAPAADPAVWPPAEFFDSPLAGGGTLRAVVCRVGAGEWQWSILSLDRDRGELIGAGVEPDAAAARRMAIVEIDKCLENALT